MLTVHRSVYIVGTDKLLSINTKMIQDQKVTCNIQIESEIEVDKDISRFSLLNMLSCVLKW